MPVGLSIVAGRYKDRHLLRVTARLSEILIAEGDWKIVEPPKGRL